MTQTASFQTRARAIDHLGRGQIADAPTAISELWKNAYDAYARNVELRIFDGRIKTAAVYDNGHGMTTEGLLNNWLVIGTDSKIGSSGPAKEDSFGLPQRVRQGEKGIGRLSAAFLAPITLVVSKKMHHPFTVLLVDWRFFENPYLLIQDIAFPIQEVSSLKDLPEIISTLFAEIKNNLSECADNRVVNAWTRFEQLEQNNGQKISTRDAILSFDASEVVAWPQLFYWWELLKGLPEEDQHGTALISIQINSELSNWLEGDLGTPEQEDVRGTLRETLVSFTDPLLGSDICFDYGVYVHASKKPEYTVLSSVDCFTSEDFMRMEHFAIGECDERGIFRGKVKAFGKDIGEIEIAPKNYLPETGRSRLGPFKLRLATWEQVPQNSVHSAEEFLYFCELQQKYGGICLYRDGLRVLPYGREGADLFDVEKRRTLHAGRHFFSYRRTFGGVSFFSASNPNLKDKAGREGLVDNKTRRAMVRLVKDIMTELAFRYFGTNSPIRVPALEYASSQYNKRQKAAEALRKRTKTAFRKFLKESTPKTKEGVTAGNSCVDALEKAKREQNRDALFSLREEINKLDALRDELKLPIKPLEDEEFEDRYREYRDAYQELCSIIDKLKQEIALLEAKGTFGSQKDIIAKHFQSNEAKLSSQIAKFKKSISSSAESISFNWSTIASEDTKVYRNDVNNFIVNIDDETNLAQALNFLDKKYLELRNNFELKYTTIVNSLEQIIESIDIEGAFLYTEQENARLEEKVQMLHTVAQLGITVEIIGHELEALESQVTRHMKRLPVKVQELTSYKLALEAHRALVDRLRFLTPLKKTAYRSRIKIRGTDIYHYIKDFFAETFSNARTEFIATNSFRSLIITDLPSRIYPTFINIINNSLYWVQFTPLKTDRKICLDCHENLAIISDTGPGVDPDDIKRLFELFYTRRTNGRGIGLYLCRQNLAVANHKIRYAEDGDPTVFTGANFIIEFNGAEHV